MTSIPALNFTAASFRFIVNHVFLPVQLPDKDDKTYEHELSIAHAVCATAHAYTPHVCNTSVPQWRRVTRMLLKLCDFKSEFVSEECMASQLREMCVGDILAFPSQYKWFTFLIRKQESSTLFELFRDPGENAVMYPGSVVEASNETCDDMDFPLKFAKFHCGFRAGNSSLDCQQFTTAFCREVLQGAGHAADATPITKRIRHEQYSMFRYRGDWSRSKLWFHIKVVLHLLLSRCFGSASYKEFMVFFMCTIAEDANSASLSSDLLYTISAKILRRSTKLGSSIPVWLCQVALAACARLRRVLNDRRSQVRMGIRPSLFRNPSQADLQNDTRLLMHDSHNHISNALLNHVPESLRPSSQPSHCPRGTLDNFLSSNGAFFEEVYKADPEVTLYDVERAVEQGIDDWLARATDVDDACIQLGVLIDRYLKNARYGNPKALLINRYQEKAGYDDPEARSIIVLTAMELFVVLDQLAVKKIPMLADYSPEIPLHALEKLLLRRRTSLHRLSRAYRYLHTRHVQSHQGWSVLLCQDLEESFPVRYYDQSKHHQRLKAQIEEVAGACQSPLPQNPLHAKVAIFELQCPACIQIWRSAAARLVYTFFCHSESKGTEYDILKYPKALQHYSADLDLPTFHARIRLAYSRPSRSGAQEKMPYESKSCYVLEVKSGSEWIYHSPENSCCTFRLSYILDKSECSSCRSLEKYMMLGSCDSNHVLATQANCPSDLSVDEFIAFGQLRSAGSLQWLNILRGLRSKTLNLRRCHFYFLLAHAVLQVEPLDLTTGTWVWHQDLHDPYFCNAILGELENLFTDIGTSSIDGTIMSAISLMGTRVLASSPSEDVSVRAIAILQKLRRKTFRWVQELSYNLAKAPTSEARRNLLLDMAAVCRNTFDVDSTILRQFFDSAEDIDAAISCCLFVRALDSPTGLKAAQFHNSYQQLLAQRDHRIALNLEGVLGDVILADVSDYGIDLAVRKIFTSHKPGASRWKHLPDPSARWLTFQTEADVPKTVLLNLLDGQLQVNGRQLGGLPPSIRDSLLFQQIFRDGFFVIPSTLPGVDFTTLATASEYKVHFSMRSGSPLIRAQNEQSRVVLELIPSSILWNDLPRSLIEGQIHWLNLSTKTIEIRPLERIWKASPDNWRIDCASGQFCARRGHETLIDIHSRTWKMISRCFECLSTSRWWGEHNDLLVTTTSSTENTPTLCLCSLLPHHSLSFSVNENGELESHDFKDMVYDENQCIEALYGLRNLLVLRYKSGGAHSPKGLVPKCILIPNGIPRGQPEEVWIDPPHQSFRTHQPSYYSYIVDTDLCCLAGSDGLMSKHFLACLHALTSSDRPDELTGETGVQVAYSLLQSGGCQAIMKLRILDDVWTSPQHPQIGLLQKDIQDRYYWWWGSSLHRWSRRLSPTRSLDTAEDKETAFAAQRGAHLIPWQDIPSSPSLQTSRWPITLDQILSDRVPPELPLRCDTLLRTRIQNSHRIQPSNEISELDQLLSSLSMNNTTSQFAEQYIAHLRESQQCIRTGFRTTHTLTQTGNHTNTVPILHAHYIRCRDDYLTSIKTVKISLSPRGELQQALESFGQWPPITPNTLLGCLASTSPIKVPEGWKSCLISFAILLLELQHARRLLRFALDGHHEEFSMELANEICDGWKPEDHPDWLLIQIQGNFLIRRTQVEIAEEIISPTSGRNSVMQVNIGEGKSSVIIPIAAAALADGKHLARVIVPKALTVQMFDLLVSRLGGLANRPIYHLPFSRSKGFNGHGNIRADALHKIMFRCMAEHGILVVQPEHVASLKLMCIERQLGLVVSTPLNHSSNDGDGSDGNYDSNVDHNSGHNLEHDLGDDPDSEDDHSSCSKHQNKAQDGSLEHKMIQAKQWVKLQKWISSHVRDILDESDEILSPRFQLVYTIGLQQHIDGHPERWTVTQQILRLVKKRICAFTGSQGTSLGWFPHTPIERTSEVGRSLIPQIVEAVMNSRLPGFTFQTLPMALRNAIRAFISDEDVLQVPSTVKMVKDYAKHPDQSYMWSVLLLLRGLLASKILWFALVELRWRIDYGLLSQSQLTDTDHPEEHTRLAVPFRAKDVPAPNAQFGHPDIALILTCLSYYYGGLSKEQLKASFQILLDEDNPATEYEFWVQDSDGKSLPKSLQALGDINLNTSEQWDKVIYPLFYRNQGVIDFYLSRVVFPQEAKEFPRKLSASNWDLVEIRKNVTTGFSGTNDAQWLFPMSVDEGRTMEHQQGTSAGALAHLLRPENNVYMVTERKSGKEATHQFLQSIAEQRPVISVLLDVGGQILNLSNKKVAEAWLNVAHQALGAIYFDENDELVVLTRSGTTMAMASSPLSRQLHKCVVYLDHAHTRGTDIRFPVGSRAAVTLGLKLTKDALVQGCMRMRKLGRGHSIMFFAPPEVDQSIRSLAAATGTPNSVTVIDILRWAIRETWIDIKQRAPHWAQQGISHKSKDDVWTRYCSNELTAEQLSMEWLQPDGKSLEDLYAPHAIEEETSTLLALDSGIQQRCKVLGIMSPSSAQLDEQQEREVHREREREREAELPPEAKAAEHFLHPDVVAFVKEGVMPSRHSQADSPFRPISAALGKSSAAVCESEVWSSSIFATADFCNTIQPEFTQGTVDQYLRPVQWVLSSRRDRSLVLLSPFEADRLLPDIRASEHTHLHLYAPRTSQRMLPSDDLRLYSTPRLPPSWTPPWDLIDQLNVFAGQLYLRNYDAYLRFCRFVNISTDKPNVVRESEVKSLGPKLLPAVITLLTIRNRGQPFTRTHMGKIQRGQRLTEDDFEGLRQAPSSYASPTSHSDEEQSGKFMPSFPSESRGAQLLDTRQSFSGEGQIPVNREKEKSKEKKEGPPKDPASAAIVLVTPGASSSSSRTPKAPGPSPQSTSISNLAPPKRISGIPIPSKPLSPKGRTVALKSRHTAGQERLAAFPQKFHRSAFNNNTVQSADNLPPKTPDRTVSQPLNSQIPKPSTARRTLTASKTAASTPSQPSCGAAKRLSKPATVSPSKAQVAAPASSARQVKSSSTFAGMHGSTPSGRESSRQQKKNIKGKERE